MRSEIQIETNPLERLERLEQTEVALEHIAARIKALGLQQIAVALLEMHKPLAGIFHAGFLVLEPALAVILGAKFAQTSKQILESPEYMQKLITCLEDKS